jgi:hypothetical protein
MRTLVAGVLLSMAAALPPASAAQPKPVCDLFTDAEIVDLLGGAPVTEQAILGPQMCNWTIKGIMFGASRVEIEPGQALALVENYLKNPRPGETPSEEPGIGTRAVSTPGQYGRSVVLVAASGGTLWSFNVDKIDQKLDIAATLAKLRVLAKKAVDSSR